MGSCRLGGMCSSKSGGIPAGKLQELTFQKFVFRGKYKGIGV
nr:MAG TPA: hypothetical protein [Caudoviricetes sp.]